MRRPSPHKASAFREKQRVRTRALSGVIISLFEAGVMSKPRAMVKVDGAKGPDAWKIINLDELEAVT
jgi:hypothetical protein